MQFVFNKINSITETFKKTVSFLEKNKVNSYIFEKFISLLLKILNVLSVLKTVSSKGQIISESSYFSSLKEYISICF